MLTIVLHRIDLWCFFDLQHGSESITVQYRSYHVRSQKVRDARLRLIRNGTFLPHLKLFASVGDPWHFGADPDPRIRTSD